MPQRFASIDEYIAARDADVQAILEHVRRTVNVAVPGAVERISYGIPTLALDGRSVVHFAAWTTDLSVYPVPDGGPEFEQRIAPYRAGKGTAKFPLVEPIPYDLIEDMALLLARRHADRAT